MKKILSELIVTISIISLVSLAAYKIVSIDYKVVSVTEIMKECYDIYPDSIMSGFVTINNRHMMKYEKKVIGSEVTVKLVTLNNNLEHKFLLDKNCDLILDKSRVDAEVNSKTSEIASKKFESFFDNIIDQERTFYKFDSNFKSKLDYVLSCWEIDESFNTNLSEGLINLVHSITFIYRRVDEGLYIREVLLKDIHGNVILNSYHEYINYERG